MNEDLRTDLADVVGRLDSLIKQDMQRSTIPAPGKPGQVSRSDLHAMLINGLIEVVAHLIEGLA